MRATCGHPGATQVFKQSFDTEQLFAALKKFCGFQTYHSLHLTSA